MTVHGYIRASTGKQIESPEVQREQILAYCKAQGLPEPRLYTDRATSGSISMRDRESGSVLLANIKKGDHVIITKLDRAFRKQLDCLICLEEFRRLGVNLHVCNLMGMSINFNTPFGRFVAGSLAAFAELERSMIGERTRDTLRRLKREGRKWGPMAPHGFKWESATVSENGKRVIRQFCVPNPTERELMKMMLRWRQDGMSLDAIRQKLNYELKLRNRRGGEFDIVTVNKMIKAELMLQVKEMEPGLDQPYHKESR